jgi:uncharacterized protein (DUF1330 family)
MTVYAIAQSRTNDQKKLDEYVAAAIPTLEAHSVELLALDEAPETIEGESDFPRVVILKFESAKAFHDWYDSPEYTAARQIRLSASVGRFMLVNGFD